MLQAYREAYEVLNVERMVSNVAKLNIQYDVRDWEHT